MMNPVYLLVGVSLASVVALSVASTRPRLADRAFLSWSALVFGAVDMVLAFIVLSATPGALDAFTGGEVFVAILMTAAPVAVGGLLAARLTKSGTHAGRRAGLLLVLGLLTFACVVAVGL